MIDKQNDTHNAPPIDKHTFREAMARLAAAVNIITSDGPAGLCGSTASAVCSVSDEPPILLVCINRASRNNRILKSNQRLCINVLRADQQALALEFSRAGSDAQARFSSGDWSHTDADLTSEKTLPALTDALVSLDCSITDSTEIGTHTVFYCTVNGARFGTQGNALVYFGRDFHAIPDVTMS